MQKWLALLLKNLTEAVTQPTPTANYAGSSHNNPNTVTYKAPIPGLMQSATIAGLKY